MLAVIIACFLAGTIVRRALLAARSWAPTLDQVVLVVLLPALILAKLPSAELGSAVAVPVGIGWGTLVLSWAAVLVIGRRLHWDRPTVGAVLMTASFGNTSYLGLGAVEALLGRDHLPATLAYDQLGNFLPLAVVGGIIVSRWGHGEVRPADIARRLFTFAPFLALLATIPLRHWPLPGDVTDGLAQIGRLVSPVAMFTIGLRFRILRGEHVRQRAAITLGIKMIAMPAAALAVAVLAGDLDDPAWRASVLEAGMPPMVTASVMATQAGLDEELCSFVVGAGLVLAAVSLPLLRLLIG